jgi:hypothetical protein
MPSDLQGLAFFPGIKNVVSCSYTLSHGITPSTATIECAPQPDFPALGGPLVFSFGALTLTFPGMLVNTQSIRRNSAGLLWGLALFDRRWQWNAGSGPKGPLSGSYNIRLDDDSLDPAFKRTSPQLAQMCLEAMGEVGYDISQMPATTYPLMQWNHEYPAQVLAQLAELEGCRVVLRLDNTVQIAKTGVGQALPFPLPSAIMENTLSINPPQRPDSLLVVGGPSRFQCDFNLEAVGLDTDGTIQLINDLSYKPAGGWTRESPPHFLNVSETPALNGKIPQELAKETVFRWYRMEVDTIVGGVIVPGYGKVTQLRQLLPIEDEQVAIYVTFDGKIANLPAWIFGQYNPGAETYTNTPKNTPYQKPREIWREKGIVKFADAVFRYDADDANGKTRTEATLTLRCAVSVRDIKTWALHRFQWALVYPGGQWGTGPRVLKHDELVYMTMPIYGVDLPELQFEAANPPPAFSDVPRPGAGLPDPGKGDQFFGPYLGPPDKTPQFSDVSNVSTPAPGVHKLFTNAPGIITESNYYLQAADLEYQTPTPQQITYAGLLPISPDGAIQQVTWSVSSSSGATTRASRNNEFDYHIPPFRERRFYEDMRNGQIQQLKKIAAAMSDQPQKPTGFWDRYLAR